MKIRHPLLMKLLGLAGSYVYRYWMSTLRFHYHFLEPDLDPRRDSQEPLVCCMWHENSLIGVYQCSLANFCCMISQHADGELIAEIARHLRLQTVRGSSTRGGIEAVRKLLRVIRKKHLGLTVDGPRGPRRKMQPGLIYLASRSGRPVVPIGFGNQRPWRLNTWDRFILPKPYSLTTCITGRPIFVPPNLDKAQIEYYRQVVEKQISYVNDLAVSWVETGKLMISQKPLALAG